MVRIRRDEHEVKELNALVRAADKARIWLKAVGRPITVEPDGAIRVSYKAPVKRQR